jgi:D-sedoheptulose 7-phosphate isomerase
VDAAGGSEVNAPVPQAASAFAQYSHRLQRVLQEIDWVPIVALAEELRRCWKDGSQVLLCGNGGSAGNAVHLANDFVYGIAMKRGPGLRALALPANTSVLTCLANDEGYESIFALQLATQARRGDVLIALSGSGNSPNILKALEQAANMGLRTYAILGYTGGKAKAMADVAIHFPVNDMQIAEDMQLVVGHMLMQWLCANPVERTDG